MRWLLLTLLGLLLVPHAAPTTLHATLHVPGPIPTDGTPVDVHLRLDHAPEDPLQVRTWIGGEDWQASRTWNGTAFERSDRYVLDIDPNNGSWDGWIPLKANPQSNNHHRLLEHDHAHIGIRARTPDGTTASTIERVPLLHEPELRLVAAGANEARIASENGPLVHRTNPHENTSLLALPVPSSFQGRICQAQPCPEDPDVILDRVGTDYARIKNTGSTPVNLTTGALVLEDVACPVTGSVPPGGTATVHALPRCQKPPFEARPGSLWLQGHVVDQAPPRPGWGDVVRDPHEGDAWAPWRLPRDVEPEPITWLEVEGAVTVFPTRSEGLREVLGVIQGARERLFVASYVFTNRVIADALGGAVDRGVDVRVVLEESPVGGLSGSTLDLVEGLRAEGVSVEWYEGPGHEHGFQHAKVIVADGSVALVLTENLTGSGLPVEGEGNVGFGVGVANASLAGRLEALFGAGGSSTSWVPEGWRSFEGRIAVVSSPENTWRVSGVPSWIEDEGRVDGMVLRVSEAWGPRPNPWLEALVNASRSEVVRVMASGERASVREDNRLGLSFLEAHPRAGWVETRLSGPGTGTVHAKVLIGEEGVVVGSSNWGLGGGVLNREVNLIVEDEAAADALRTVFEKHWMGDPGASWRDLAPVDAGVAGLVVGCFLAAVLRRGWRGG